jgi:hypothetical protein
MPITPNRHSKIRPWSLKRLPYWALIAIILGFGVGTAGVMTILAQVNSSITFSVSQPLAIEDVVWHAAGALSPDVPDTISDPSVTAPNRQSTAASDDGTGFSAAAEIATGDQVALQLHIGNRSKQPLFGQLDLTLPDGLSAEVYAPKSSSISKITRLSNGRWIIRLISDTGESSSSYLNIVIAASDVNQSISTIRGELTPVSHDSVSFDLHVGGDSSASTVINISSVNPGDSGISFTHLENIGDLNGILDILFSDITETGGTGDGEYEDGIGDLGDYLELAVYLDTDQSGDFNAGDIGLKSDNTIYVFPASPDYALITEYGNNAYYDLMTLVRFEPIDIVILWRVSPDAGNNIQGDSCSFTITFILKQVTP